MNSLADTRPPTPPRPTPPLTPSPAEPSLAELVGHLAEDLKLLTRQEIELAKRELTSSLSEAKRQGIQLALGAGALLVATLSLVAAAVLALATVMAAWAAALVVAVLLSVLGLALVARGKANLARVTFKPEQALHSMEKDILAIKQAAK